MGPMVGESGVCLGVLLVTSLHKTPCEEESYLFSIKRKPQGAGNMVQSIKCLQHKYKQLSLDP